ncbi:Clan SC, family S33, methylesterase-like serine peptidase [Tritrichomonas foetus]|uniref:Clan SC, family S33, methylesterase-like serine peptidase n=1 Tax=Tritrichomonas foetus TaxID=1144522 RepID=A0A1J4KE83_9EUKA|nr:Clan SC, family S33, methylesterase-like serine peptidase [Tritrichomonas foetus]|eukprot:OHT09499.1 Clan SC, family S33, methylesterase-like serine peptidase [Tritrichomonas foetus]
MVNNCVNQSYINMSIPIDYSFDYDGENFTMELDGQDLIGCQWIPPSRQPKFIILFFHGLGAFLTVNRPYFPTILANDGAVFGTDHLGHGRSPGERGYVTDRDLFNEIRLLVKRAKAVFPDIPLFIYGHSLGGLTVLSFICSHPEECDVFDGVIIEAPWLYETVETEKSIAVWIVGLIGKYVLQSLPISTGEGFQGTSYPEKFIEKFMKSNLSHDYITPMLYASAVTMRKVVHNQYHRWPKRLPLLFMQGAMDGSVGVENNLEWAEKLRDLFPEKVKLAYHKDAEHAMLRGEDGELILKEVIDFITSNLSTVTMNSR